MNTNNIKKLSLFMLINLVNRKFYLNRKKVNIYNRIPMKANFKSKILIHNHQIQFLQMRFNHQLTAAVNMSKNTLNQMSVSNNNNKVLFSSILLVNLPYTKKMNYNKDSIW